MDRNFGKKILTRLNSKWVRLHRSLVLRLYRIRKLASIKRGSARPVVSETLFDSSHSSGKDMWVFHDEHWVRVIHRFEHRPIVAAGNPLEVVDNMQEPTEEVTFLKDGTIHFDVKTETKDEWAYLYLDPEKNAWADYRWKLRIRRDSQFREFQLGFRYQDFYNRYRYRFEDDHIYFDKVVKGRFYNEFGSVPFHMELGVWYDVEIHVYKNNFKCYVNDSLFLNDFDFSMNFQLGSIAIILWEKNGVTDIKAAVGPIRVSRLVTSEANRRNQGGALPL